MVDFILLHSNISSEVANADHSFIFVILILNIKSIQLKHAIRNREFIFGSNQMNEKYNFVESFSLKSLFS